jgi:RHS repeat-associated protein
MNMPGRKYTAPSSTYRYGYNGKENDNEVKGEGSSVDFGARIYDSRLGRFLSLDPMSAINPGEAPYTYAGNSPIGLTDFEGLFKISPYFVKKYPTLAKILKYVLPAYINDASRRDQWISKMGFSKSQIEDGTAKAAWEDMLTYGKGPWITPTLIKTEIKQGGLRGYSIYASRFGEGSGNTYDETDGYMDNVSFSSSMLQNLETALKASNDEEVAFNAFRTMILIIHESGHWARFRKVQKPERSGSRFNFEEGAMAEEGFFGRRFSYTDQVSAGDNRDAIRDDLIRKVSNTFRLIWKAVTGQSLTSSIKNTPTPVGQNGDPVIKEAGINEGKVFVPSTTTNTGKSPSGKNKKDYTY